MKTIFDGDIRMAVTVYWEQVREMVATQEFDIVAHLDKIGFRNRPLYDPDIKPRLDMTGEEYKKGISPTVNHFYEKLLLLKDMMNTPRGKEMAEERHRYMEEFLSRFFAEWNGER